MHMMCACMCKLHVLFQYVLVCIKPQWHKIVWQINQNVLLQHPCLTTHVCNFLHTLSEAPIGLMLLKGKGSAGRGFLRKADRIYVMKAGEIVESGDHDSLIQENGLYAQLSALQFADG